MLDFHQLITAYIFDPDKGIAEEIDALIHAEKLHLEASEWGIRYHTDASTGTPEGLAYLESSGLYGEREIAAAQVLYREDVWGKVRAAHSLSKCGNCGSNHPSLIERTCSACLEEL